MPIIIAATVRELYGVEYNERLVVLNLFKLNFCMENMKLRQFMIILIIKTEKNCKQTKQLQTQTGIHIILFYGRLMCTGKWFLEQNKI